MKITDETREILERCSIDGNKLYLPPEQLDRELYMQVNKALEAMGGKWNRTGKCHIFDESVDVEDIFNQVIETGEAIAIFKEIQFFETPDEVIDTMLDHAHFRIGHAHRSRAFCRHFRRFRNHSLLPKSRHRFWKNR